MLPTSPRRIARTPAECAQLIISLASAFPETVEAAMVQCPPRRRSAEQRRIVEQLIAMVYDQLRADHQQAGSPFGPGTRGLAQWICWLAGSPQSWS